MNLQVEYVSIDEIFPYANNAKIHTDEQIDEIANSINEFGMIDPIGIWKNNEIIEGHGRLMACKKLGIKTVPIIRLDELTDEQRKAYALAHNKLTMNTDFDFSILDEELASLEDIDMSLFGFEKTEVEEPKPIVEDEFSEDVPPRTERGQVWILGDHRLMCGDSTNADDVEKLMDGAKADMVMTDPPYGINAEKMTMGTGAKDFYRGKDWDSERPSLSLAMTLADDVCIWGGNYFTDVLPISNDWLVWHKKNDGLSFSECELAWTNFGRNVRHISHHWGNEKKLHVTMKPVPVIAWAIQQAKKKAEIIVDLFGGSGSTLIACEQTNRKCFMMELDPHYCDVIIERWENFTSKKAVLLDESE